MKEIGETKYYSEDEFNQFPWDKLEQGEFATNGDNYNFGKGGVGYPLGSGHIISIFNDDTGAFRESVWAVPKALSRYMDWIRTDGSNDKLRDIRSKIRDIKRELNI